MKASIYKRISRIEPTDLSGACRTGRIGGADPNKTSLAAPEFNAALEVRVEDPYAFLSPKALEGASFPQSTC